MCVDPFQTRVRYFVPDKTVGRENLHKHPQRLRPLVLAVYKTKSFCSYCSNITKCAQNRWFRPVYRMIYRVIQNPLKWFSRLISEIYGLKLNRGIVQFLNGAHSNIWLCESAFVMRMKQFRRASLGRGPLCLLAKYLIIY